MGEELAVRARAGDEAAFEQLVARYRRELQVHCYRILGSAQDAEDALQETLVAAWRALPGFEGRSSLRTWLYRIATSRCLNLLRAAERRGPDRERGVLGREALEPARAVEVPWLEPYPDVLLDRLADGAPGPEARYESGEAVSLAFITALQLLPPSQRAALVLRDVLGFPAAEAAEILDATVASVNGALRRARATLRERAEADGGRAAAPAAGSPQEQELVRRFTRAYTSGDVDGVVALLTEDVWLTMPPGEFEYRGRDVAEHALSLLFATGRLPHLIATRANGQPAFGVYVRDPQSGVLRANGLLVVTLSGDRISAFTRFFNEPLARFGLPRTLPAE